MSNGLKAAAVLATLGALLCLIALGGRLLHHYDLLRSCIQEYQ